MPRGNKGRELKRPAAGGNIMPEYRAYFLDKDGHVESRIDIICEDQATAEAKAKQLVAGHDVELWQGDKKIASFSRKQ